MACDVGLLHAEVSSGSINVPLVQLHNNSVHNNFFFINLGYFYCNTLNMEYSDHGSNDTQYYIAINNVQLNSLSLLTQNQIP